MSGGVTMNYLMVRKVQVSENVMGQVRIQFMDFNCTVATKTHHTALHIYTRKVQMKQ
jgi:hypothetical protein